jgi:hypothetical protein
VTNIVSVQLMVHHLQDCAIDEERRGETIATNPARSKVATSESNEVESNEVESNEAESNEAESNEAESNEASNTAADPAYHRATQALLDELKPLLHQPGDNPLPDAHG